MNLLGSDNQPFVWFFLAKIEKQELVYSEVNLEMNIEQNMSEGLAVSLCGSKTEASDSKAEVHKTPCLVRLVSL